MMRFHIGVACLIVSHLAFGQGSPAFEAGRSLGQSAVERIYSNIGSDTSAVPRYGASASESGYFAGGRGDTFPPGIAKVGACATYTPGADRIANQECEAVNLLARNPQVRPQFNLQPNDPMLTRYRQIRDNAEQAFEQFFPGGTGTQTACTTRTETIPGQYTTEICVASQEVGTSQCTIGRVVNIDADANFQCDQTVSTYETSTCERWADVRVDTQCTQQWVTRSWNPPTGPFGHVISTYDDFRFGANSVCAYLWPGSTAVSATCYPPPPTVCEGEGEGYTCYTRSAHGGCDYRHNGGWGYSIWYCPDQGWCNGDGIASITCRKLEPVCNPVPVITWVNGCSSLESRAN